VILPSYTTVPESLLGSNRAAILQNFQSVSLVGLRGLGCDCSDTDSEGNCYDPEPCSPTTSPAPITTPVTPVTYAGAGSYQCANGTMATDICDCPENVLTPACSGTGATSGSGSGLSPSQQLALDTAIAQGGANVAKIIAAGATGVSVLPNGAVISPGAAAVTGITAAGGTTIVLVIAVVFAFMFMSKGGGR
jgi:hypothetical protein